MSSNQVGLQSFDEERSCIYRGESYSVRDNGAVLRFALGAKRRRPLDLSPKFPPVLRRVLG
jgi:hypothetical protein